jgi:hypothetical protein
MHKIFAILLLAAFFGCKDINVAHNEAAHSNNEAISPLGTIPSIEGTEAENAIPFKSKQECYEAAEKYKKEHGGIFERFCSNRGCC